MYDEEPETLIKVIGLAVSEVVYEREPICKYIQARVVQYGTCTPFTDLKAALVGMQKCLWTILSNACRKVYSGPWKCDKGEQRKAKNQANFLLLSEMPWQVYCSHD